MLDRDSEIRELSGQCFIFKIGYRIRFDFEVNFKMEIVGMGDGGLYGFSGVVEIGVDWVIRELWFLVCFQWGWGVVGELLDVRMSFFNRSRVKGQLIFMLSYLYIYCRLSG